MNNDATSAVAGAKTKLAQSVEHLQADLKSLRTGRASVTMLDGIVVEAYGSAMPLVQVATVTVPDAQLLQITPFDPNNLQAIATSIRNNAALGLNPSDDGRVVRVPIPPLTEERRREIAKQIGEKVEDCMVRMRGIRHEALDAIDKAKKDKVVGEDEARRLEKQVDDDMTVQRSTVEVAAKAKEQEILKL